MIMNHTYHESAWFGAYSGAIVALGLKINVALVLGVNGNVHFFYTLIALPFIYLAMKGAEQKSVESFVFSLMFLYFLNCFEAVAYQYGYFGPSVQFGYAMYELNFYVKLPILGPIVCITVSFTISLCKKIAARLSD